jgi:archaellum component FlaC
VTIDERLEALTARHEALTMNVEIISRDIEKLRQNSERDGENIRALARIAEIHERPVTDLEEGDKPQ